MGNTGPNENAISEETLDEYVELTSLSKSEIRQIYKLLDDLEPGVLKQNLRYRFSTEQINKILPQIRRSPFRDRVFSRRDGYLSFEDTLDLCSATSSPRIVRGAFGLHGLVKFSSAVSSHGRPERTDSAFAGGIPC
ncbi:calcium and integrin-binding protein 1-like [Temnothorax nylanderi]|uniref:calcium and integrin-binding protein 1-like n=1 Tax=Temnothorax nylanderi TaxID=102681 RepID=UPI003A87CF4E